MDFDLEEIDKLLTALESEKGESDLTDQPEVVPEQAAQDGENDGWLYNETVNRNNVSDLGTSNNVTTEASNPSIVEQPFEDQSQDNSTEQLMFELLGWPQSNGMHVNQQKTNIEIPSANESLPISPITLNYQLPGQQLVLIQVTQDGANTTTAMPTQIMAVNNAATAVIPLSTTIKNDGEEAADNSTATPKPGPSGSKKRKLYEEEEFSDSEKERKRLNAINARRHRENTKKTIQNLNQKCDALTQQVEKLQEEKTEQHNTLMKENEELREENKVLEKLQEEKTEQHNTLMKEIEELREENKVLKHKHSILVWLKN